MANVVQHRYIDEIDEIDEIEDDTEGQNLVKENRQLTSAGKDVLQESWKKINSGLEGSLTDACITHMKFVYDIYIYNIII